MITMVEYSAEEWALQEIGGILARYFPEKLPTEYFGYPAD